jgi:hypothetical protein
MARRKNVKRIDPRYFLNETVNRGENELEEGFFGGFLGGNRDPWDKDKMIDANRFYWSKAQKYYPGGSGMQEWMRNMLHSSFSGKSIEKAAKQYLAAAEKEDPDGAEAAKRLEAFGDKNPAAESWSYKQWKEWGDEIIASLRPQR